MFRNAIFFLLVIINNAFAGDLLQMAEDGHPQSQFDQAMREININTNEIPNWLLIAALQDHQQAAHYLKKVVTEDNPINRQLHTINPDDRLFIEIYGPIAKITKEDLSALRKEGNQGDINTQYLIWKLYVNDKGFSKAEAWVWLKKAAGNNHPRANFALGLLYYYGYIVPEERKRAMKLISKSSDLGFNLASAFLESYRK